MTCPEQSSYNWSILCKCSQSPSFARINIRESSTNNKCDMLGALWQIFTPAIKPSSSPFFNRAEKASAHHKNKGKVHFPTLNSRWSSIFNLQLWNQSRNTLQLLKPDKFGPRLVSKAVFYFRETPKFYIIFLNILTSSNEKTQNYKVVDLIENYNFHAKVSLFDNI